ncbi:hypothetical protein AWH62_05780 [Maricaulis sp. W15]|uniref:DUF885 domain-containing protein n=1 Tax=Maricaulis sp. W15 TaxID=1772333 RepID=UPI000948B6BC|nr:DUF885 domain-containing protein [Maricaulis sp. W15]OLF75330.1 hypothetical protein AWH62_05780 [Maricaulis sp. W15]
MLFQRPARLLAGASLLALSLAVPSAVTAEMPAPTAKAASQADAASASAAFSQLIEDFEAFERENSPGARARDGDLEAAGQWYDVSEATLDTQAEAEAGFLARLEAIEPEQLDPSEQISHAVLDYILRFRVELAPFDEARQPFQNDSGFFSAPSYASSSTRLRTIERADAWVTRINAIPDFFDANIAWMRRGLADGFTQPRLIAELAASQVEALSDPDTLHALLIAPIDTLPEGLPADERARVRAEAEAAIRDAAIPAYENLLAFFRDEYIPQTRESLGISEVAEGRQYYQTLVRYHTTLDTSPEEVHQRGLNEVARIRSEMDEVISRTGFEGTFAEFLNFLRTDPQFYAETPEELLMHAAWISKRADDAMPRFFGHLPRLPYGVRPVPDTMAPTYTTGRYWPGDIENGVAGGYMVNTYDLTQRPLYTLPALTVHEAVPGHHHQISIAAELEDVPDFRRNSYITAFGEGWGLYTETLATDMGLYTTPYEEFGRLTYEMWRACRLVVDTGIHYMGWTQEQAEACLLENSALAPHNVRTEVQRYISWPGQALAYKSGELLMRDLRAQAEAQLGADFDIRAFHDHLLADGAMPLSALEAKMLAWIDDQATALTAEADE